LPQLLARAITGANFGFTSAPAGDAESELDVDAPQFRQPRLRADLGLVLDQQGADMADLPGGASGMWCATARGRKPIGW
jgi:hypothetical protein